MSETVIVETSEDGGDTYACTICGVKVRSETTMNTHLRGRSHQFNLDKHRSAARSVYVRGFPKHSAVKNDLQALFEQFGKVKNMWLPGNFIFAIIEFAEEKVAEHVLHMREPLLIYGKRLTVKPRDIKLHGRSGSEVHDHGDETVQADQEHSDHRGRRFRGHHGGGRREHFEEPRFKFDPEVQQQLSSVNSADEQLKVIHSYYKMPVSAIRAHLSICSDLTKELQRGFPEGLVVPFGAAISGHGTITSDCDICLFTQLSVQERSLFTPPNYQPLHLKGTQYLNSPLSTTQINCNNSACPPVTSNTSPCPPAISTASICPVVTSNTSPCSPAISTASTCPPVPSTTFICPQVTFTPSTYPPVMSAAAPCAPVNFGPSPCPPVTSTTVNSIPMTFSCPTVTSTTSPCPSVPSSSRASHSPARDEILSSSSEASSPASSPQTPSTKATSRSTFDLVASCIRSMPHCSKLLAIPQARCPIVRFVYNPARIHCDLSIDNMLGPANTRLMQAYSQFDERFALLVPFVRLWVKHSGPPRTQLNNYAVSMMLIYSLQRIDPPVLPCLQDPGTWPKNMDWFTKHGFAYSQQQRPQLKVGPWTCDFVPPDSLLPSTNTQTPAELLVHFFKFYSDWKASEEVVAIHCPRDRILSPSEANALATQPRAQGYKVRPFRDNASLIIQDPFEFDHNLCKALSKANFTAFIHHLKMAAELLTKQNNILPLFDRKEHQKVEVQLYTKPRRLVFNIHDLKALFRGNPAFSALGEGLEELDMSDSFVHKSVSLVTLEAVIRYLQHSLNFTCSPSDSTEAGNSNETDVDTNDSVENPPDHTAVSAKCQPDIVKNSSTECVDVDKDKIHQTGVAGNEECSSSSKNERGANEGGQKTIIKCAGEASGRKRGHDSSNDDTEQCDETKRTKKGDSQPVNTLDILRQVRLECQSAKYVCTAMSDSWTHRRQRQRKIEQQQSGGEEEKMDTSELTESLPSLPPLLSMKLVIDSSRAPLVVIKINQLPPLPHMHKFNNWFALVNKELHRHPPSVTGSKTSKTITD